jgi:hypothetical protein
MARACGMNMNANAVYGGLLGAAILFLMFCLFGFGMDTGAARCMEHPTDSYCQSHKPK